MKTTISKKFCYDTIRAEAIINIDKDHFEVEKVEVFVANCHYSEWSKLEKPESEQKFYDWICERMDEEIEKHDWSNFK